MNVFENDGSYPGDLCASTTHPGHKGYLDSQWKQWKVMSDFYRWCCGQGIYLTVPDWYFLNGQNKTGMGYTENDWSLPRQYQPLIERQDIYDGTWEKTPSMGWMHVPLMQYHGGGSAATVEPLHQNLAHYEMRLSDLFGAGVQAAWRGDRLYDTNETRDVVRKWVDLYKKHRAILNSDIIHLRRPDGKDWDGILHVNPRLQTRGLAVFYNPLNKPLTRDIELPLYYTGLTRTAKIQFEDMPAKIYSIDREYKVALPIKVPAHGCTWITIT
jgi:alpha-galactosidase